MPTEEELKQAAIDLWNKKFPDSYKPTVEDTSFTWTKGNSKAQIDLGTEEYDGFGYVLVTIGADNHINLSGPYEKPARKR